MKVFKFGGASVKDADSVKNVASILGQYNNDQIVVVVSAMGKTTNMLEKLVNASFYRESDPGVELEKTSEFHFNILHGLFTNSKHPVFDAVNNIFVELEWAIEEEQDKGYDFIYDQVVSIGEVLSSTIISAYLNEAGIKNSFLDIRDCIKTDNNYREGNVNWDDTTDLTNEIIPGLFKDDQKVIVTQGFIGGTSENYTTTLGREGSDYTASILAAALNTESVTIWKDVAGLLNADPKWFSQTIKFDKIRYSEATELAYYGATIIHPKTIKPIQNKGIPLYVKSFIDPQSAGTVIGNFDSNEPFVPSFIFKMDQILISISALDLAFIIEENLSHIFSIFAESGVKINLMQNSAISFSVCVNNDPVKIPALIETLKKDFKVLFNDNLELVTIRHYTNDVIENITTGREILIEQKSRHNAQYIMRSLSR